MRHIQRAIAFAHNDGAVVDRREATQQRRSLRRRQRLARHGQKHQQRNAAVGGIISSYGSDSEETDSGDDGDEGTPSLGLGFVADSPTSKLSPIDDDDDDNDDNDDDRRSSGGIPEDDPGFRHAPAVDEGRGGGTSGRRPPSADRTRSRIIGETTVAMLEACQISAVHMKELTMTRTCDEVIFDCEDDLVSTPRGTSLCTGSAVRF